MSLGGARAEVPVELVTLTCTVPVPPGEVAVIEVPSVLTVMSDAGVDPNNTVESEVKPDPFTVTCVPPFAGPELGVSPVTTGM